MKTIKMMVYTRAEISWWTHHIYCLNPARTFTFPGINLYKTRLSSPRNQA